MKTEPKYTPEQEEEMTQIYLLGQSDEERSDQVDVIAAKYNKNRRMIIAKLSKMEVYVKPEKRSKVTDGKPETKEQMVKRLEIKLGCQESTLISVEKATKIAIKILLEEY